MTAPSQAKRSKRWRGRKVAKKTEPWGETTAAIVGAVFAVLVDKVLQIDKLTEHVPLLPRIFFIALMALGAIMGRRYYVILDGADQPHDSWERKRYDTLRRRLSEGGTPAIVYNRWLTIVLDKVDEFFGDVGRRDKSWIARALHLETDGPRWTAPAFDRCLLLALVYPIVTVFAVWAFSGHVGPAERTLGLPPDDPAYRYPGLWRGLIVLLVILASYACYRSLRAEGVKWVLWFAFTVASSFPVGVAGPGAFALSVAFAVAGVFAVAFVVQFLKLWATTKGYLGLFLSLFFVSMCILCLAAPYGLAPLETWPKVSPLLLFLGLLTLVNAPFDWFAVGFTRALLRRGLLLGNWWPFVYALIDMVVAAVLIAGLAFAMVIAIQTFDDVAVLRGGADARILPLGPLFTGLQSTPSDYEYWWVWFLLFSSMIPSILNLSFAAAFLRGLPGPNKWILDRMPVGKAVREHDHLVVASALTGQILGGVALTGIATYITVVYLIPLGLPAFGAVVRDFANGLALYDAPTRVMKLFVR
jgi:hypothetical protein